jgi:hypothetical protein
LLAAVRIVGSDKWLLSSVMVASTSMPQAVSDAAHLITRFRNHIPLLMMLGTPKLYPRLHSFSQILSNSSSLPKSG